MAEAKTKNPDTLATRLARVMKNTHGVRKDGRNTFQKYDYATSDAVLFEVRRALSAEGVMFLPSVEGVERIEQATKSGRQWLVTLTMTMRFLCGETGEALEMPWRCEATDTGDKAINKAQTAGVKYYLLKTFLIPTSDEPDADAESPEAVNNNREPITFDQARAALANAETEAQRKAIAARIRGAGFSEKERAELRPLFKADGKTKGKMAQLAEKAAPPIDDRDLPGEGA